MKTTPILDQEIFNQNLLLTQAYCEKQLVNTEKSPAAILRSFNPEYEGKPIFSFGIGQYEQRQWNETVWSIDPLRDNCYQSLFVKQLEYKRHTLIDLAKYSTSKGRILVAKIDETLWDGASESSSDGLVDVNDCPPIDAWFYLEGQHGYQTLFAWIPESFLNLAQNAIDVNCMDCLKWYEDWIKEPVILDSYRNATYTLEPRSKYWIWVNNNRKFFNIEKLGYTWAMLLRIIILLTLCALVAYFGLK